MSNLQKNCCFIDGNVAIYVNGIGGNDDHDFRKYLGRHSNFGGVKIGADKAAFYGHDYNFLHDISGGKYDDDKGGGLPWFDFGIAFTGTGGIFAPQLQISYEKAYWASLKNGEPFYVVAHSGGAGASGVATGLFNMTHGYGTVSHQYNINGADAGGFGTGLAEWTGTQVTSYYTATDVVSWYGAAWDWNNPFTLAIDPGKNLQTFDPFHWGIGNFQEGTFGGHTGGSNSAFGQWMGFDNVFGGKTVGSKALQGAAISGLASGDLASASSFASGLLAQHISTKILRTTTWLANPINIVSWFLNKKRGG